VGVARGIYPNNILVFKDTLTSPAQGTTPWEGLFLQAYDDPGSGFVVSDHFLQLQNQATNGLWLVTKGTGGSIALSAASGKTSCGWIKIPTAASASDYVTFSTQEPIFTLQSNLDLAFEVSINVTEAATNAASWYAGFTSVLTTGFLSSGVPPSSYSGAVVYKTTGALAINAQTSNSTTQVTTSTALASEVSGTTLIIGGVINHNNNTTAIFTPYISTVASNVRTLVAVGASMNLTIASLANMYFAFGIAAGSGGTAETLYVDYAQAAQGEFYQ
jgi:hypothetical protein